MKRTKRTSSPYCRLKRGKPTELTLAWQAILNALPDQTYRNALTPLIYYLSRHGIEPHQVTDRYIDGFIVYLKAHGREPADSLANSAIKYWSLINGMNLPPLTPRPNAKSQRQDEWAARGPAIHEAIETFVATRKGRLKDGGQNERNALRLATHIVADAVGPVTAIEDLVSDDAINAICDEDAPRRIKDATRILVLQTLRTYCKMQLKKCPDNNKAGLFEEAIETLTALLSDLQGTGAIPMATVQRLIPFDDRAKYEELLRPCARLIEALPSSRNRKHDLPRAQAALTIILSVSRLRKPGDIANASFTGDERIAGDLRRPTLSGIEDRLGPAILALIDQFYAAFTMLCGRPPRFLAEKIADGQRDQSAMSKIVRRLLAELGFDLTFSDLQVLGIKRLIAKGCTVHAIADAAGFVTTANFTKRFGVLLDAGAAQDLDDATSNKDKDDDDDE